MTAATIVQTLAVRGVRLAVEGANLRAFGPLIDDDRTLIREHKPALLALLADIATPPAPEPVTVDDLLATHGEIVAGCRTLDVLELADPDDLAELREADALAGFARALLADRRIRPLPAASLPPLERLALEIGDDPAELRRWLDLSAQGQRIRQRIEREPGACDRALLALRADPAGGLHAVLLDTLEGERLHAARPGR